jgi:cystathionine beta-lyase family protein involved in aluminum resistance
MKIDGALLAKANARKKMNLEFKDEGRQVIQNTIDMGKKFESMMSFIQAVHEKNPVEAHKHMYAYQKQVLNTNSDKETY